MKRIIKLLPISLVVSLSGCNVLQTSTDTSLIEPDSELASATDAQSSEEVYVEPEPLEIAKIETWTQEDEAFYQAYEAYEPYKLDSKQLEQMYLDLKYPDDMWHEIRSGFEFDNSLDNSRIQAQLNWYKRHPKYLDRVSDRASRYMHFVMEEIKARGMPTEFALLPIVESAFDPFAYSHGRASGMWQFIPSTGRLYGMKQDWWYDGRRDILASTKGALNFLSDQYKRFNDWDLALAAYNSGPGNVSKAIRYNKKRGRPTDFWALKLPKETQAYVPKMYALAKLVKDPEVFGIQLKEMSKDPYFEVVDVGSQIDLAQAARLANIELNELYLLNPGFNQWATSPDGPHHLLIPIENAQQFREELAAIPENERLTWERYKIASGDSLITIAKKFHTTVDVIRDVNNIRGSTIRAGKTLLIPVASKGIHNYELSAANRLAKRQNIKPSTQREKITYYVKSGDTLWDLARKYNVSVRALAKWNGMAPRDTLKKGQKLVIWQRADQVATAPENRSIIRKIGYKVRSGDSLYKIANKFNTSVAQIKKWNVIEQKYLQPGQHLTLYVDVTRHN